MVKTKELKDRYDMKKIWKNLCVYSMAFACGVGLVGCGNGDAVVSKDLDGDGVISSWETVFDKDASSSLMGDTSSLVGEIEYIRSAKELENISNNTDTRKMYVLKNDIDLGGKEVCIDLGVSQLYGNNHIISNFKLGKYAVTADGEDTDSDMGIRCLFYGGVGVYDVRLFVGVQSLSLEINEGVLSTYTISPFVNTPLLEGVSVKGKLKVVLDRDVNGAPPTIDASLLFASRQMDTFDEENSSVRPSYAVIMDNVGVDGYIDFSEVTKEINGNVGYLASQLPEGSQLLNGYAKVDADIVSSNNINVGGIVGANYGFLSSCNVTGKMAVSFEPSSSNRNNIGGIVGYNGNVAEIKNCSTNVEIDFSPRISYESYNNSSLFVIGGIVGNNDGGVLECNQSDASIKVTDATAVRVGGIAGISTRGIISYSICRGSINIQNTKAVYVAQVSGFSELGMFEKIITTTSIKVDNSNKNTSVYAGMVTIFEDIKDNDLSTASAPYFQKILVDGGTEVYMKGGDIFQYELGLRNKFRTKVMEDEEDGDSVYQSNFPAIFKDVCYTTSGGFSERGCYLVKYNYKDDGSVEKDENVVVDYAKDEYSKEPRIKNYAGNNIEGLIKDFDFKNFLNHNEVNLQNGMSLSQLSFTLNDAMKTQSYFTENRYSNVGLAYVADRNFDTSYKHDESSKGSCEYDDVDAYLSYLRNVVLGASNTQTNSAFKVSIGFLNNEYFYNESDGFVQSISSITENAFKCLNTIVSVTQRNYQLEDILNDDNVYGGDVRYLEFSFSDSSKNYVLMLDIENLTHLPEGEVDDGYEFIVYLTISTSSKITGA